MCQKSGRMRDGVDSCLRRDSWIVYLQGSRRPYTSARKVHNPWSAMKAAVNSVTHTTAFLASQVQVLVVPRTRRTSTSFFFWWRSLIETETSTKVKYWLWYGEFLIWPVKYLASAIIKGNVNKRVRIGCFDELLMWNVYQPNESVYWFTGRMPFCHPTNSDLHICSVQKSIGQKSIQYVGSVPWNEIPQLLKNPTSKYTFKRKLKAHCWMN